MVDQKRIPDRERKPGEAPLHRIPIYDHKGNMRGHVGHTATEATVARFTGQPGATLKKKNGRDAWVGDAPPPPPKPKFPPQAKPAAGQPPGDKPGGDGKPSHTLEISLKAAKGSISDTPKKPEAHARPRR
jgi:hypothetical protein